jgi:hypothetical protein
MKKVFKNISMEKAFKNNLDFFLFNLLSLKFPIIKNDFQKYKFKKKTMKNGTTD